MIPVAPARLSTMMFWPSSSVRRGAMARTVISVGPPAEKGTTTRIGFTGNAGCAETAAPASIAAIVMAALRTIVMTSLSLSRRAVTASPRRLDDKDVVGLHLSLGAPAQLHDFTAGSHHGIAAGQAG